MPLTMNVTTILNGEPLTKFDATEIGGLPFVFGMIADWEGEGITQTARLFVIILNDGTLVEHDLTDGSWHLTQHSPDQPIKTAVKIVRGGEKP